MHSKAFGLSRDLMFYFQKRSTLGFSVLRANRQVYDHRSCSFSVEVHR